MTNDVMRFKMIKQYKEYYQYYNATIKQHESQVHTKTKQGGTNNDTSKRISK
jgi:hypothetical protein